MTHRELCEKAARYLKNKGIYQFHKCQYVVCELERAGESPDAFGISSGYTQLIEVKISRSDFLSDKNKLWRKNPESGLGMFRSYLCPDGLIKPSELPENWGLLYFVDNKVIEIVQAERQISNSVAELAALSSILRREGVGSKIFSYKKYKANHVRKRIET